MKYLELSIKVREDDEPQESIIYKRSIIVPDNLSFEDWQEQSVSQIKQTSDEVARRLTEGLTRSARA